MSDFENSLKNAPTPCYVLDESRLIKNMEVLNFVEKASGAKILCALKGFAMWEVFPLLSSYISGGTASSLHEAKLIHEKMNKLAHSCFVVYTEDEFEEVNTISSHLTFNSLSQFNRYQTKLSKHVKYALRLNPEFSNVEFEHYNPCMPGSRFGITLKDSPEQLPEGISGLHFHTLCESSSNDFKAVLEVIEGKFGHLLHQASWVNFGGGHHITRDNYDVELLVELLSNFKQNYNVDVFLEPGEAIGLNTGVLKSKVEDIVVNNNESTAILNVSFSAHMPDCLEMPYKPTVVGEVEDGVAYTLGGNTCMSGDFVKGFQFEKSLKIGDEIIFEDMMHYTFVKTTTFNGVQHPSIGIIQSDGTFKLVRLFNYNDYKNKLS